MDVRKTLIDLITASGACFTCFPVGDSDKEEKEKIADYLIAHGVTVQQWIPVTERLPDKDGKYLVMGKFPREMPQIWICDFITFGFVGGWSNPARNPMVKAWMPLPEPPKEEEV